MLETLFMRLLGISITTSVVILLLKLSSGLFNKTYAAKWKYWIWLVLALRLIIPFNFSLPATPVTVDIPNTPMSTFTNTATIQQNIHTLSIQVEEEMENTPQTFAPKKAFTCMERIIQY